MTKRNLPMPHYTDVMKEIMARHTNDNTGVEMTAEGKQRLSCWCWRGEFDSFGEAHGFLADHYENGLRGPQEYVYTPSLSYARLASRVMRESFFRIINSKGRK